MGMTPSPPNPPSKGARALRNARHDAEDKAPPEAHVWPPLAPGEALDLRADDRVYRCPTCGRWVARLPTGTLRYHGATLERGRRCDHPEAEGAYLRTLEGLDHLTAQWPQFAPVYDAVRERLHREVKRPHGGPIRNPDPRDPLWRWKR